MGKRTKPSEPIVIRTTPEMDNWLHPQTEERKQRIKERTEAAIKRFRNMTTWDEIAEGISSLTPDEKAAIRERALRDATKPTGGE